MVKKTAPGGRWGIALIAIGLLWLFTSLGWLSWDFWAVLWLLWPLVLILFGLSFLLRDNPQRIPVLMAVGLVGGGLLWMWHARTGAQGALEQISIPLGQVDQAQIRLAPGVGRLEISALEEGSASLIQGQIRLLRGERLERRSDVQGGVAMVALEARGRSSGSMRNREGWELSLSPRADLRLNVNTGVGETLLNLRNLRMSSLEVSSGVGRVQIELPERGIYRARIEGGVGELDIRIPQNVAVRLEARTGLGGLEVPDGLLKKGDNRYESPDYARAAHRADLEVRGGVGRVVLRK
ncbi:DUF5668 domain-containing protein [uncultured Meiothermus sp.]|jgi:hypothetical protein|uniref:LiaF transmembrane domain-containing protein n=1 Tax=uncultured Meiothermus sp. TaxID=157471 RepID=UPI00263839B1|nr:DUF5668 domain-containing protein [uncultured Meiothermus sp.]